MILSALDGGELCRELQAVLRLAASLRRYYPDRFQGFFLPVRNLSLQRKLPRDRCV
jgi:hypothetical protein